MEKKKKQLLSYYPLSSLEDIDFKIKEIGQFWRYIEDIKISYEGGAYRVTFMAREIEEGGINGY